MATQYTTDIPFSSSHHQQAFKLLELPPELLALLESDNPPMCVVLPFAVATKLMHSAD
jgi:sister chromatid cohesion protein DCC1